MPTNQLASEALPEGQWWHGNPHDCWGMKFYGNPDGGVAGGGGEMKEAMFEKALTPSDVGKLNRLVIPKQHAERYFPLESELSFHDEAGKLWRFRYSYWNSSQSYVLTKGWSRFVKDKTLHAGDIVSFHGDGDRLYIGWKRRRAAAVAAVETHDGCGGAARQPPSSSGGWGPAFYPGHLPYPNGTCIGGKAVDGNSPGPTTSKRLRLFGVNLDFPADEPNGSCWLSQGQADAISFQRVQSSGSSSQS